MATHVTLPDTRRGLNPTRTTLPNGVVVLAKATHTMPAVTINLAIRSGSICDPVDSPGAMYLLSRTLDRGTASRSADDIAEALDSRGISLTITVTRHVLSIVCTCLADDFEAVAALLADIVMSPSLPELELATRKGEIVTAIRQDADNPGVRAVEALMTLLYPNGHPYGRPTKGDIQSVERFTREDIARLHLARFAPTELTAVIVGDIDAERANDVVARTFGGWMVSAPEPVPLARVTPATTRQRRVIPMMNKAQADIAYGFTTIVRRDPAYYAYSLMNHVFGQYSMSGRLGDRIREKQGMAYYVFSTLDANLVEGPLLIRAGVGPANVDRTIASIDDEITRLVRDGVTEKELNESRQYLIYAMPRSLETNAGIASFLQNAEFFGLGLDYDVRLPDFLRSVSLDDVNAAARSALDPDRASLVIAGPYREAAEGGE